MTLANRFNSLLHLGLVLVGIAFSFADDKPLLALLAAVWVGLSWMFSRGNRVVRPLTLPRIGVNLLVMAAIVNAVFRAFDHSQENPFVSTLGQFLLFLALTKLLDRREPRDEDQVVALSVAIGIAAMLTSNSFVVGVLLIIYVPVALVTAMLWQIRAGQAQLEKYIRLETVSTGGGPGTPSDATPDRALTTGLHPRRGFAAVCVGSLLATSALASVGFVFLPRGFGNDLLGNFGAGKQAQIGFVEAVKLGQAGFLSENATPVMDVQLTDSGGRSIGAAGELLYLRGGARDEYDRDGYVWKESRSSDPLDGLHPGRSNDIDVEKERKWTVPLSSDLAPAPESAATASLYRTQKFTMRGGTPGKNLFTLWRPISVRPDRSIRLHYSARSGAIRCADGPGPLFTYTVESRLTDHLSAAPVRPRDFQEGRIRAFTDDLLASRNLDRSKRDRPSRPVIAAIRDYLRTNYTYTTEMVAPPQGTDPLEFFLFERKSGHCEYFASAMTAMCQSQGIPARIVTGYLASEFNSLSDQYVVRESNAHAWVEAFVTVDPETGRGRWETFEPSPQADIERLHRPPSGVFARIRSWYDALEIGWSNSVVGFDNASRRTDRAAMEEMGASSRLIMLSDRVATWIKTLRASPGSFPWLIRWFPIVAPCAIGVIILVRSAFRRVGASRLRTRIRAAYGLSSFKPSGFYARALKALDRAGTPKPESVPPARFADVIAERSPTAAEHLRALAATLYQSRFGGRTLTAAELAAADDRVRQLEAALRPPK